MKYLSTIIIIMLISVSSTVFAQNPVPNPSFENWTYSPISQTDEPDDWTTSNDTTFHTVVKYNGIVRLGNWAAKGIVLEDTVASPTLSCDFPALQQYTTMKFWYVFQPASFSGDLLFASVSINDSSGNPIGGGAIFIDYIYGLYSEGIVPITYSGSGAASATIDFTILDSGAGPFMHAGSQFELEDVSLEGGATSTVEITNSRHPLNIYPNPSKDVFTINADKNITNGEVVIYDVTGAKVHAESFNGRSQSISCKLEEGFYFIELREGTERWMAQMVKNN